MRNSRSPHRKGFVAGGTKDATKGLAFVDTLFGPMVPSTA